ncbi:MAG TPA: hypothetical protein VIL86_05770 [Tepidisphaeraceae bacterium]|jgi:hypothetical protein
MKNGLGMSAGGLLAVLALVTPSLAAVLPSLGLVKSGSAATSDSISQGTATYDVDLLFNSSGFTVSGLQYYISTNPAGVVNYTATPLTMLNNPFTASDVSSQPAANATVQQTGGTTALFKSTAGDYPAVNNAIVTYHINTSTLTAGNTVIFTPTGQEMTNANGTITNFATPATFTLTVTPEPATLSLLAIPALLMLRRRARSNLV